MKIIKKNIIFIITFIILSFNLPLHAEDNNIMQLKEIETSIWGFPYEKDTTQKRLSRIESNIFGSVNSNQSIENRIKKINEAMGFENIEDKTKEAYEIDKTDTMASMEYPQIDTLEIQMFQKTYPSENIYKRLERLEKKIFGSSQDGSLASRTDRLKGYIKEDAISKHNPDHYNQKPYSPTQDMEQYMGSQNKYENSDIHIQIAGLENTIFSKTYSQDPVGLRLNRLERKIFQRDFSSDDDYLRLQRLQAAANAQQTAKLYEANKIQKYASTGIQLGSIILMILALIL